MTQPRRRTAAPPLEPGRAEQLRKVLDLEARTGYANRAVIGGLDRLLATLAQDNNSWPVPAPSYLELSPQARADWSAVFLSWLGTGKVAAGNAKPAATKARAAKKPAAAKDAPAPTPRTSAPRSAPAAADAMDTRVGTLPGVQRNMAARLEKLGVKTIRDLLYHFPARHLDFSQRVPITSLVPGQEQTVAGFVWEAREVQLGRRMKGAEVIIGDDTGNLRAVWFNQPYLVRYFKPQSQVALSGKVSVYRGQPMLESPEYEVIGGESEDEDTTHTGRLVPIYPLTEGLSGRTVRRLIKGLVDKYADAVPDATPLPFVTKRSYLPLADAIRAAHYPESQEHREQARERLAYDELLVIQLSALQQRLRWQQVPGYPLTIDRGAQDAFLAALPFRLTGAQQRVVDEILGDITLPQPMSRLLQGDVGSGKTVVAAVALLQAVANGYQGALMAPTEILAEQHYRNLSQLFGSGELPMDLALRPPPPTANGHPVRVGLLTGSMPVREKEELQRAVENGDIDIIVGTHALIQERVAFRELAVAVIDEQHRFGVSQRASLRQKGHNPHILVMSATPIPRTLALTVYGDLVNSVLDELPPGRQEIRTKEVTSSLRDEAYHFVRDQVQEGSQAFIICPLIEESPVLEVRAATAEYERLSALVYPDLRLGLLHGRMSASEKEAVMNAFHRGELNILVSTTVVEVGIDVPNATVMLIEGADRFGLAQLHQLRGRVGRGSRQSYCLLLTENASPEVQERLKIMENTTDGFRIAEEDLRLRGPGEFFGTRQTGLPELRMARLEDWALLQAAREDAGELLSQDPDLERPEHTLLAAHIKRVMPRPQTDLS